MSAVVALALLRPRLGGSRRRAGSLQTALKAAIAAAALAVATALVADAIDEPLVAVIAASVAGALVYLGALQVLGTDEIRATMAAVRRDR